ncbi:hypothetical protein MPTK1_1g08260 [Marchantia polymorpha subsp. ruderalis]|uniref:F-box domain-containing protein n=2 Tax=Marchantia polymorpha TaxID=3197 RepID=A0AAF6AMW0_MARPO|nr:hypothetical protein MARPO_0036s0069 [Marchantia polymorpha]BBM97778.1 hypothetical protein Mp_1g08260 [Marchantia polymorpha subsp. ruderalis]PTQ41082.1 hypothetical protein MARPO_0036s0069 [Marchantia polymorpha]PTQ41083.1 hypothetical protein MARPO_0036s0069 [Marchantia polymorpha]BBM97779.1 hypothetical protein Mp_1g08260 [Marchantia polymorpha subsp. ruderalis]|eukprot:PTQ41081.1 hypothetical protein MARPO_0036s0069 [Marchantia polymorpha]
MGGVMKPMGNCAESELKFDNAACDLQLSGIGFEELPESCIAHVLCFLSPRDIAISACTNRTFRGASLSDVVWQAKLPRDYTEVLAKAKDGARAFDTKKQIFDYLCSNVPLRGHEFYWLSRSRAVVYRSQGAEALDVVWGSDRRYWHWRNRRGSSYDKSAYLKQVCWLHVKGSMECSLPVGRYTLSWRFALEQSVWGFALPIELAMSVNDHETVHKLVFLKNGQSSSEAEDPSGDEYVEEVDTAWKKLYVGDFSVEEGEKDSGLGRVKLQYSLVETRGGNWKSGLWLDGVVIMPK